jgi:pimeloyl-ACP methyl ester carboxylesterase
VEVREIRRWDGGVARFARRCGERNGALLRHLSTADSARDLDLLRRATGDPLLTYRGMGYGTLLGATYANLFPTRVRAMVLDGVVDPLAWSNGGNPSSSLSTSLRLQRDEASARTLQAFLRRCGEVGMARCPFAAPGPGPGGGAGLERGAQRHPQGCLGELGCGACAGIEAGGIAANPPPEGNPGPGSC